MSAGESVPAAAPRKSKSKKIFFALLALIATAVLAEQAWSRYTYPYGASHCCILVLGSSLEAYAQDHGGRFPSGGDSPEASLSLLYSNYIDAYTLRGKTVPLQTVERALKANGKLGPESCGWHYVEGLTLADDPRIAIVWDKVGLGHDGQRLKNGAHEVRFVGGDREFISRANWPEFLKNQQELLEHGSTEVVRGIPALTASIRLPTGQILTNCSGPYELRTIEIGKESSGHGSESGSNLELVWYRLMLDEGQLTWVLTLPDEKLRSKPVTFSVKNGRATPSSVVFEMENY
jgi:hypothetical protein